MRINFGLKKYALICVGSAIIALMPRTKSAKSDSIAIKAVAAAAQSVKVLRLSVMWCPGCTLTNNTEPR
jgi:hypothetical protein